MLLLRGRGNFSSGLEVTVVEQELIEKLRAAAATGERPEGVLFHATCEPIAGPLEGGGYDGVLWTATSPVIAQQYIPASGSSVIVHRPFDYELDDGVRPNAQSWWHDLARRISGMECSDVETDGAGRAQAWRIPEGWPTYRDCIRHLEDVLGYRRESHGGYEVKQAFVDGRFVDKPADWQIEGAVYVTASEGLRFKDLRRSSEGDLGDLEYHDVESFEQAAREGYDGVIINDFAQVDGYGNVGHVSYGLLPQGCAKAEWLRIPAVRRPLKGGPLTLDVMQWLSRQPERPLVAP